MLTQKEFDHRSQNACIRRRLPQGTLIVRPVPPVSPDIEWGPSCKDMAHQHGAPVALFDGTGNIRAFCDPLNRTTTLGYEEYAYCSDNGGTGPTVWDEAIRLEERQGSDARISAEAERIVENDPFAKTAHMMGCNVLVMQEHPGDMISVVQVFDPMPHCVPDAPEPKAKRRPKHYPKPEAIIKDLIKRTKSA